MRDELEDALSKQTEQETQMKKELSSLVEKFAHEYCVTTYQIVGMLEDMKMIVFSWNDEIEPEDDDEDEDEWWRRM